MELPVRHYDKHGVFFSYPDDWELIEQDSEEQISITLQSPGTSFWMLVLCPDCPDPEELADSAVFAFQDEYQDLDVYDEGVDTFFGDSAARKVEFVCLELLNTAVMEAIPAEEYTALVMYQSTDHEFAETEPLLRAITGSLEFASVGYD